MKFIKFFHLDFRRGIHTVWKLYLCEAMLFALLCVDFWNRSRIFLDLYPGTFRSLGDLALYIFGGMKKFIPTPGAVFPFPTVWLLVMALACFSSLWYPLEDLYGFGKTLLTACQSRKRWYLAKAMWCGVTVSLFFCAGMGCTAIGVFGHGRKVYLDHFPLHDGTDGDHRCGQHRRGMAAHFAADPAALAGSCNTVPTPAVSLLVDAASAGVGGIHRGAAQFRLLRQPTPAWKLRHGLAGPASSGRWGNLAGGRPLLHGVIVALRIGGADLFPTYRHFGKRGEIMSIIFENVTKTIHGKTVLQGVTLSLETGRVTGLRGINGSGKTMLLRLLAGLIHPSEGKITIDGKTLGKDMEFPPSMGLLIENPAFLGQYTGAENLEMLASLHQNVAKEDVRTLLEKVGLAADGDTKYRKYSLGMKQRLGIAGAILGKPELLLLDEPTNALDTKGVELLREIIGEERQRGAAVVVACHEAAFLESVSDEIYCLENGQLTDHLILREKGGSKP